MFKIWDFGGPTHTCSSCNAILWYEERNKKSKVTPKPEFSLCCRSGKVELPMLKDCPLFLKHLLDYNGGPRASRFREKIRLYNSIFSFTSMGGNVDKTINDGRGPYVFRINGQNHHKIGSLLPIDN